MSLPFGQPMFFEEQVRRFSAPGSNSHVHVLLHSTNGNDSDRSPAAKCLEPFELAERMWICRLPDYLRDIVYRACESPGEPYQESHRQFGQLYTVALFMGPLVPGLITSWDGYRHITRFLTFSQLVHPTSIGFGNTSVLTFDSDGQFKQATPGPCRGITEQAFTIPNTRNWLSLNECETVKNLMANADIDKLPARVSRAHWNVQHAAYQYFFEVRALLVASALDALVHVRTNKSKRLGTGKQFTERTLQLSTQLGIHFTNADAASVWEHRSDIAHGRDPWESRRDAKGAVQQPPELTKDDPLVRQYLASENILRSTILKCLTDPEFAARFESDESVEKAYPVVVPQSKKS
ncbi:MAG: hypothetical protein JWQ87_5286 [Candidatus Sulfotelmatobacter sp.]|nr:hypothetical protein [Candidatus Sulfotelmatobacter sp.]